MELDKTDLTNDDLNRLARKIPSSDMTQIGVKHLKLTMKEMDHCSDLAKRTNNFSYHHSLFCLMLWREKQQIVTGAKLLKQCLYYHLKEASKNTGLIAEDSISFLQDQVEEVILVLSLSGLSCNILN